MRGHDFAIRRAAAGLLLTALLVCALQARAHTRSVSYSSWALDAKGARVTLHLAQLELTRLPWGPVRGTELHPSLGAYLAARLQLLSDAEPCVVRHPPRVHGVLEGRIAIGWRVDCGMRPNAGRYPARGGRSFGPADRRSRRAWEGGLQSV